MKSLVYKMQISQNVPNQQGSVSHPLITNDAESSIVINEIPGTMSATEKDPEMQNLTEKEPEPAPKEKGNSASKAIYSCILYSFCSVSMVLVNKSLASRYAKLSDPTELYLDSETSGLYHQIDEKTFLYHHRGCHCLLRLFSSQKTRCVHTNLNILFVTVTTT